MEYKNSKYGPFAVRLGLGVMFLAAGIMKLMNPSGFIGMVSGMGLPMATLMGWLAIIAEVAGGAALVLGWKVRYAVWPLVIVLLVAIVAVWLPQLSTNMMAPVTILLQISAIASLVSLFLSGPGALAVEK